MYFFFFFFFFNDTATTEIYTLSLHDALPISAPPSRARAAGTPSESRRPARRRPGRSEEHTAELPSPDHIVCRLLLLKKKKKYIFKIYSQLYIYSRYISHTTPTS